MTRIQTFLITSVFCAAAMLPSLAKASEQVVVIVKTFSVEGRESELQDRSLKQIEFLRKAEPTATFRLYRSLKTPTTFLWYEVYESQAAHENHLKVVMPSFRKELGPAPKGLFSKPPEIESYVELAK
jgi:quinol monooxygenase YgiN